MRRPGSGFLISSSLLHVFFSAVVCPLTVAGDDDAKVDEHVVVTATRLDDKDVPKDDVPASVTILDREQIEASGARNLQDLLAGEAGIVLFDQVGNDVQKSLDLRGFAGGKGIAVFVDGARVNDPRNNSVALEQVPLAGVERIEITRGPAAALAGGGAEAGVIRVVTRRGTTPGASLSASAGSWNTRRYDGTYGGDFGRFDLFVAGTYDTTDGFRPNGGGDQTRLDGALGLDLGGDRRLSLSVLSSDLAYGNPGALTLAEFDADPEQNVYNRLDATDDAARQAALNFQGPVGGGFSLAANLAFRGERAKTLTTGRTAAVYGGFFLDADGGTWSGAAQATRDVASSRGSHRIAFGAELLDGETDSTGFCFLTSPPSPLSCDPNAPPSRNTTGARNSGLFLQDAWTVSSRWIVTAGARGDRSRVRFVESIPGTTPSDTRTFSEVSFRAGTTFRPSERWDLYASYGDAFLPPTPEQLFAFPIFFSNPDLLPEDARAYEVGARTRGRLGTLEAALFWTDTKNEIVFEPTPTYPSGRNVNADATRRRGVEVSARGRLARQVAAFANVTYTDAAFTQGTNDGNEVPLVPKLRVAAGIDAALPVGFGVRADALYVGPQVLDNDPENDRARLVAYTVVNVRLGWERALDSGAGSRAGHLGIFVEAKNVFDEKYATRGIASADYLTDPPPPVDFVTPAPGRRYLAGVTWRM